MSETKESKIEEPKIEEPKIEEPKTLINKIEKNEQTLVDELNDIEKKKQSIHDNIHELSTFYMKLKGDLLKEEQNIEEKRQQILIDKEKLKNENEISLLGQDNIKLENYLGLLEKKHDLELKYLEQCCDHKSRIQKIGEKYSFIDVNKIVSLDHLYKQDLRQMFHVEEKVQKEPSPHLHIKEDIIEKKTIPEKENKSVPPPPAQRRHTIAAITKNNTIENNSNDMRINGSLQDHLKHALSTKYKALRNRPDDSDSSES